MTMDMKEQEKPLSSATHRIDIVEPHRDDVYPMDFTSARRQRCLKCCGCSVAVTLLLVVTLLVLMLTVFHVKDPSLTLNAVTVNGVDSLSGRSDGNLTLVVDVSVKNPNAASFRFDETTTYLDYGGSVVGEGRTPSGRVGARRSVRVSVLVEGRVGKMVEVGSFGGDLRKGVLGFITNTRMSGEVRIRGVGKKSVVLDMKCSMNLNVSRKVIEGTNCSTNVVI